MMCKYDADCGAEFDAFVLCVRRVARFNVHCSFWTIVKAEKHA